MSNCVTTLNSISFIFAEVTINWNLGTYDVVEGTSQLVCASIVGTTEIFLQVTITTSTTGSGKKHTFVFAHL